MNLFIIGIPILLIIPALFWLFTRKAGHGTGEALRPDNKEPKELTGAEQAKHRKSL